MGIFSDVVDTFGDVIEIASGAADAAQNLGNAGQPSPAAEEGKFFQDTPGVPDVADLLQGLGGAAQGGLEGAFGGGGGSAGRGATDVIIDVGSGALTGGISGGVPGAIAGGALGLGRELLTSDAGRQAARWAAERLGIIGPALPTQNCPYLADLLYKKAPKVWEVLAQYKCGVTSPIGLTQEQAMIWLALQLADQPINLDRNTGCCTIR